MNNPTVLICGSREWPNAADIAIVKAFINQRVEGVKAKGYDLIAGDAGGVDTWVCQAAITAGLPITVFGITPTARHKIIHPLVVYQRVQATGKHAFWQRDRVMVDRADYVLGLWNGVILPDGKKGGTRYTFEYAVKRGRWARLMTVEDIQGYREKM